MPAVQLHECIALSSVWILFLSKGDSTIRQLPFQSSVSLFSSVHSIFVASASKAWKIFVFSAIDSALKNLGLPWKCELAKRKCVCSHSLSSGPRMTPLPVGALWDIRRLSSLLSLRMSLSSVPLRAKCGVSSTKEFPCLLGRSPIWLLWDWLYPVLWKRDELSCAWQPEALFPIHVAGIWEVHGFTWELGVVCC